MGKTPELKELFDQAWDIVSPHIQLESVIQEQLNLDSNLRNGIKLLKNIVDQDDQYWQAYFLLGKSYQALKEHDEAFNAFLRAHKIELQEPDVMRELGLECLYTKRYGEAVYYCNAALEFDPKDYTLLSNLALARICQGQIEEAERDVLKSLKQMPDDPAANNVLKIIQDIKNGTRQLPIDFTTLENE